MNSIAFILCGTAADRLMRLGDKVMKHVDVIFIGRIESRLLRGQSSSVERCFEHSDKRHLFRFFHHTDHRVIRVVFLR